MAYLKCKLGEWYQKPDKAPTHTHKQPVVEEDEEDGQQATRATLRKQQTQRQPLVEAVSAALAT